MIPQVKVPTFSMTLPVSKEKVDFRPFLVKEEKILLLVKDSKDPKDVARAIGDVVSSCTFDKMSIHKYCLADVQYAFIQIRGKSIGEELELDLKCGGCDGGNSFILSVNDFDVLNKDVNNNINMGDITIRMKSPTIEHYTTLLLNDDMETIFSVICGCIEKIYSDEEVFINEPGFESQIQEFLDNLPSEEFDKIKQYFSTMPMLHKKIEFTCKHCKTNNEFLIDGLSNFF